MAKGKKVMALGDDGPFMMSAAKLRRLTSKLKVVAWAKVDGAKVHTCSYDEEALGLHHFIAGWCVRGYYVRSDRTPAQVKEQMAKIEWLRVARISSNFCVRPTAGAMIFTDKPVWFVSEARYMRLMRHCMKTFNEETFEKEVTTAIEICKRGGQKPTHTGGTIEVTH